MKRFLGHSLKEEATLWEAFMHLRTARNTFVHEGAARVNRGGNELSSADAARLVAKSREITEWVRERLPAELQWPVFLHTTSMSMELELLRGKEQEESIAPQDPPTDPPR